MSAALHRLRPHPAAACPAVQSLHVSIAAAPSAHAWQLRYELVGELAALRLPEPVMHPQATDGLWRHSCFEAFVGASDAPGYREFNFAPTGDWAAYAFSAERMRAPGAEPLPAPRITCTRADERLTLEAWLPWGALPASAAAHPLGLSAVIETRDGQLSHWALAHPRAQPDFHHRAGWTARLPLINTPP